MNSARIIEGTEAGAPGKGAAIVTRVRRLPTQTHTVTAEVLARLLAGDTLTSLDAVYSSSTTRLSAVIHRLRNLHGWPVQSVEREVGCNDGRTAFVAVYTLGHEARAAAMAGAAGWCEKVRADRQAQRAA